MTITCTIRPRTLALALIVGLVVSAFATATAVAVSTGTRQIPSGGTTTIRAGATGSDGIQQPEIREGSDEDEGAGSFNRPRPGFKNGKFPKNPLEAPVVASSPVATANPELDAMLASIIAPPPSGRLRSGHRRRASATRSSDCQGSRSRRAGGWANSMNDTQPTKPPAQDIEQKAGRHV